MFGPRITTVFKSRRHALIWSAGILLLAYCSVPAPEGSEKPSPKDEAEHVNPWAKTRD